jgi:tetratricopeptide (TPR) repeat protein
MIDLSQAKPIFRKSPRRDSPVRIFVLIAAVFAMLFLLRGYYDGNIQPLSLVTPTPTRTINSFALEGETHLAAGDMNKAIAAYQSGVQIDPNNAEMWAELARIQTYSTRQLTTDEERLARLQEALVSVDKAVELAPDSSLAHAVRAFVYDWLASQVLASDNRVEYLTIAEKEAVRALQLDPTNALAMAYYAEILTDQQKLVQAEQYIRQALDRNQPSMDVYRVLAYVRESLGYYEDAVTAYRQAIELTPNLTFLHIAIGVNYRVLAERTPQPNPFYGLALETFEKAALINEQLGIKDPIPYIAIANTYANQGEFFAASRNIRKALLFNPYSANIYGQTGVIFFKAKNYEGSIPALRCAVRGCGEADTCDVRLCDETDPPVTIQGLPLNSSTLLYYYTYGSVLAALHRPSNNYCEEAMKIMGEVRAMFNTDPIIMGIIEPSEQICQSYGY